MSLLNDTTKKGEYKHLNYTERTQIERWLNVDKKKPKEIANLLNKSIKTIRRERKRGLVAQFSSNNTMNDTGNNTIVLSGTVWNKTHQNDNKYVGYMYGGASGTASSTRNGLTSTSATFNETSNTVKTSLDSWYQTNISGKPFENKIVDNIFCNDRQLRSEIGGPGTGTGYGTSTTYYAAYHRLYTNNTPTYLCNQTNDRFTTSSDVIEGNNKLTYPVGLISADEAGMAGFIFNTVNLNHYLYSSSTYWTMTPYQYNGSADMFYIGGTLFSVYATFNGNGLRPVINLDKEVIVTGEGTSTNPFIVS